VTVGRSEDKAARAAFLKSGMKDSCGWDGSSMVKTIVFIKNSINILKF